MERVVRGVVRRASGVWANAPINFALTPDSYTANTLYPENYVTAITDAQGYFEVSLWINTQGAKSSQYWCTLPSRERFRFDLPFGTEPIDIGVLRAGARIDMSRSNSLSILEELAERAESRTFTNADLTLGKLVQPHGLNRKLVNVTLFDGDLNEVNASNVKPISEAAVEIDLNGWAPITGVWEVLIA